jgi:hypothetical protein
LPIETFTRNTGACITFGSDGCFSWSFLALISQPLVTKIYAVLSVVAVIVVEAAIGKRRKKADQPETAI